MQSSGERAARTRTYVSGKDANDEATSAPHSVIASAAKQSRVFPRWDSGLLRCARNDGDDAGMGSQRVWDTRGENEATHPRHEKAPVGGGRFL
jgi:hypothetical protein